MIDWWFETKHFTSTPYPTHSLRSFPSRSWIYLKYMSSYRPPGAVLCQLSFENASSSPFSTKWCFSGESAASLSSLNEHTVKPSLPTSPACSARSPMSGPKEMILHTVWHSEKKDLKYHHLSHHPSASLPPLYLFFIHSLCTVSLSVTSQ